MAELSKQHWSAERYAKTAHFVPAFGAPVVGLLAPQPGERILDLGCGDGVLTAKIAATGATIVAVDAAPDMVAAAKARGLDARVVPGQSLAFEREFDAVEQFKPLFLHEQALELSAQLGTWGNQARFAGGVARRDFGERVPSNAAHQAIGSEIPLRLFAQKYCHLTRTVEQVAR